MPKVLSDIWDVHGVEVPVRLYGERRHSKRISITKTGINIRVPNYSLRSDLREDVNWAREWIDKQVAKSPDIIDAFRPCRYESGQIILTPQKDYPLQIREENRKTSSGKLKNGKIIILLSDSLSSIDRSNVLKRLIGTVIGKDQLSRVSERIHYINDKCFRQSIKSVKIKNNSSNWGSCSSSGNINISIKTLLAPFWVQDYIFVHELAHRIEMNHSKRYWDIVAQVLPDYKKAEKWLKENSNTCEL